MQLLWVRLLAPFAAFRPFQAGAYRTTSSMIPYSAAWGLLLNLAGIEVRGQEIKGITSIDPSAPRLEIALGSVNDSEKATLYQQLHTYPVGNSGEKDLKPLAKGAKYWIAPIRREFLMGFDAQVGVRTEDPSLIARIKHGLNGELQQSRYGLPFAGDNNFLFDRIDVLDQPVPADWYVRLPADSGPMKGACRLTVGINRLDCSKTTTQLFAPVGIKSANPPAESWIWTPAAPI